MTEKALVLRAPVQDPTLVTTDDYETIQRVAKALVVSGFFQVTGDYEAGLAQVVVKVLAGKELGIPPVASVMGINLIKGKVSLSAHLMLAAAKRAGYDYRVHEAGNVADKSAWVNIDWFRGDTLIGKSGFSMEEAAQAKLLGKADSNWQTYPKDMLFWRAVSRGVRRYCPDATSGIAVYAPDELGKEADPETGEVVEIQDGGSKEAVEEVRSRKLKKAREHFHGLTADQKFDLQSMASELFGDAGPTKLTKVLNDAGYGSLDDVPSTAAKAVSLALEALR